MIDVTSEALNYIGDRKEFWISHGDSKNKPNKALKIAKALPVDRNDPTELNTEYVPLQESWRLLKGEDRLTALQECVKVTLQAQDTVDTQM